MKLFLDMMNLRQSSVTWVVMSSSHCQTDQESVWVGDRFRHCWEISISPREKSKSRKGKQINKHIFSDTNIKEQIKEN